jgi:hypothetical protein
MLGAISVMLSTSYIVKGTLLFVSLNIEVGYCQEVEPDGIEESLDVRYLCCPAGCDCRWLSDFRQE